MKLALKGGLDYAYVGSIEENDELISDYPQNLRPKTFNHSSIKKIQVALVDSSRSFHHRESGHVSAPGSRLAVNRLHG